MLDNWLQSNKFKPSLIDTCLYIKELDTRENFFAIATYVNDIITVTNDDSIRTEIVNYMKKTFKITDLGEINWILGTHLTVDKDSITIDQGKYANDIIKKFQMKDANMVTSPAIAENKQTDSSAFEDHNLYLSIVGSINYLAMITRPDITYATSKVAQQMSHPSQQDWIAAKRIIRYVKNQPSLGIMYSAKGNIKLIGYSDSDWAGDLATRKSTSGYCFLLGGSYQLDEQETTHNCLIQYRSRVHISFFCNSRSNLSQRTTQGSWTRTD